MRPYATAAGSGSIVDVQKAQAYWKGQGITVGSYPKCQMLAKVPKMAPMYPKPHAQLLAKVPKMAPKYPKYIGLSLLHGEDAGGPGQDHRVHGQDVRRGHEDEREGEGEEVSVYEYVSS